MKRIRRPYKRAEPGEPDYDKFEAGPSGSSWNDKWTPHIEWSGQEKKASLAEVGNRDPSTGDIIYDASEVFKKKIRRKNKRAEEGDPDYEAQEAADEETLKAW